MISQPKQLDCRFQSLFVLWSDGCDKHLLTTKGMILMLINTAIPAIVFSQINLNVIFLIFGMLTTKSSSLPQYVMDR